MSRQRMSLPVALTIALGCLSPAFAGTFRAAEKNAVSGEYLVVLRAHAAKLSLDPQKSHLPSARSVAARLARRHHGQVVRIWDRALRGFLLHATEAEARKLAANPAVESVEQNFSVKGEDLIAAPAASCYGLDAYPWGSLIGRTPPSASPQTIACDDPDPTHDGGSNVQPPRCRDNWGLDRIDQRSSTRDGLYTFDRTGRVPGVVHPLIMFLDSGINARHQEFIGLNGRNRAAAVDVTGDASCAPTSDTHGHGTHVAAIAAGRTFGVAKDADILMIRTLSCAASGHISYPSWIVDGLNTAAGHRPGVLSWSGGNAQEWVYNNAIRTAVKGVVNSGVLVIQAAGNQSSPYVVAGTSPAAYPTAVEDACSWSFGTLPGVLVVGGVDQNGARWTRHISGDLTGSFCPPDCGSNVGSCIDLWAPAANIISAAGRPDDSYSYCRLSGTSMAAPHVAGVAAFYLQTNPLATPQQVEAAIIAGATTGVLNVTPNSPNRIGPGSPNRLLYSKVP